ncbi:hypothetical protein O181_092268 [Austropuccinia psidii MF-1]|uniref:Uncharacterized protein n=1 Tax=Austropuccinia psidii MF-1 TaxID=1389203 RepID=A0A9Q3IYY0_9BASI|nr:hypothetical protein [Austropuccinia psidii MF-1]
MRQDHGKHSWPWWKEQIISKWINDSWRFEMENSFDKEIYNIERDRPMSSFLKQNDRLTALNPDMSETVIDIGKDDTKGTNDVPVHESDSEPSEEEEFPDELSIENINVSFEVKEVHTHLTQYSDECMDHIHVQNAKMQKAKPARGKGYTSRSCCITNIVINNRESKIHLESGAFSTCVGKDYLENIYTNWKDKLIPIECIKFSSASQNMQPLGIFKEAMIFYNPTGNIRLQVEFYFMNNCTSQHFILGNDYLNIYGIDINNHQDRYFTIGENKRQKFSIPPEKREITVIRKVTNVNKEKFVSDELIEAQLSPELTPEMKEELIEILLQYREAFSSYNEPLGAMKGHEVGIMLNVDRPYPPLLRSQLPQIALGTEKH